MSNRPVVLNFSGNDSAGLAGMAMDIRTQAAMGVHSANVITANTAQNNQQVLSINPVAGQVFVDQLTANTVLPVKAIKVGLLATLDQVETIVKYIEESSLPLVLDPVVRSSSGCDFLTSDLVGGIKQNLFAHCAVLTPNIDEAEVLTGIRIQSPDDIVKAADKFLHLGVKSVLIKGGHFNNDSTLAQDYFSDGQRTFWLTSKKINTTNLRGTGCALSSAIASALALGYSTYDAVVIGKMAISQGLRHAYAIGTNSTTNAAAIAGPVAIQHFPDEQIDLPVLTKDCIKDINGNVFPKCNEPMLGLYPVVDRAKWIENLASTGVTTIQLRIKDLVDNELEQEIQQAIALANRYQMRLFINDYWQLAIKNNAYGVHLGQEDLDDANIEKIRTAGLRLGISTHCHYEVARAHAYAPSYIACGPVYHTNTKQMPWVPHGLEGLSYWRKVLSYPLVAIGGINQERFAQVQTTGVDSIAMITAITLADDPQTIASKFVQQLECVERVQ